MKLLALLLSTAIGVGAYAQTHEEAKTLLNEVYESTLALQTQHITFINSVEAPSQGGMKAHESEGELFAKGEMVRIKTKSFIFLSDGNKAYFIYPEDEEIEEAANAEETTLSPAEILKQYQDGYSYKMAGQERKGEQLITYIRLKPVASEEVKEILLGVDASKKLLVNYKQFGLNGVNNTFEVKTYEVNVPMNSNIFDINGPDFQGYYRL